MRIEVDRFRRNDSVILRGREIDGDDELIVIGPGDDGLEVASRRGGHRKTAAEINTSD